MGKYSQPPMMMPGGEAHGRGCQHKFPSTFLFSSVFFRLFSSVSSVLTIRARECSRRVMIQSEERRSLRGYCCLGKVEMASLLKQFRGMHGTHIYYHDLKVIEDQRTDGGTERKSRKIGSYCSLHEGCNLRRLQYE